MPGSAKGSAWYSSNAFTDHGIVVIHAVKHSAMTGEGFTIFWFWSKPFLYRQRIERYYSTRSAPRFARQFAAECAALAKKG
jgi:hypothetical protein